MTEKLPFKVDANSLYHLRNNLTDKNLLSYLREGVKNHKDTFKVNFYKCCLIIGEERDIFSKMQLWEAGRCRSDYRFYTWLDSLPRKLTFAPGQYVFGNREFMDVADSLDELVVDSREAGYKIGLTEADLTNATAYDNGFYGVEIYERGGDAGASFMTGNIGDDGVNIADYGICTAGKNAEWDERKVYIENNIVDLTPVSFLKEGTPKREELMYIDAPNGIEAVYTYNTLNLSWKNDEGDHSLAIDFKLTKDPNESEEDDDFDYFPEYE